MVLYRQYRMYPNRPGTYISAPSEINKSSRLLFPRAAYLIYISPTTPTLGLASFIISTLSKSKAICFNNFF